MPVLNAGAAVAGLERLTGVRVDPFLGHNFIVEIQGLIAAGFQSVSGLNSSTGVKEVWEGGQNDGAHMIPERTTYEPLELKKGLTDFDMMWSWYQDVVSGKFKRRNGTIYLLAHSDIPVMYWNFKKAFPSKWTGPSLNAEQSTVAAMSVTLVHEGLSNPVLEKVGGLGRKILPGG